MAVLAAGGPAVMGAVVWWSKRTRFGLVGIQVSPGYFALPLTAVLLAAVAWWRRSRVLLPAAALVLAAAATAALLWFHGRAF